MTYRSLKSLNRSTGATCARTHETKKTKKETYKNWLFAQTTHVIRSKHRLAWLVVLRQ